MTKYPLLLAITVRPWEQFVKAPSVQYTVYRWSQLEHHVICKSATVAIYSCFSVNLSHLTSSGKQHKYTFYKWTQNIKNNVLLLQSIQR